MAAITHEGYAQTTLPQYEESDPCAMQPTNGNDSGDEEICIDPDKSPLFQGKKNIKFRKWVLKRINFPEIALKHGIQGRVLLQFIIEKDGSVSNITSLLPNYSDPLLANECIRVVSESPKWTPGTKDGANVRVRITLPLEFIIDDEPPRSEQREDWWVH